MWEKMFLLLLHGVPAAVASQCWQGATFSEAVVSPAVEGSGILRVPGIASLSQCVSACCDMPGYNLAWLLEGRCYILSCQRGEDCKPREKAGADSVLAFLQRASPQTLVLQSPLRGAQYAGHWRTLSQAPVTPGSQQEDPNLLDVEYSKGIPDERGGWGSEVETTEHTHLRGGDGLDQSEAEQESSMAPNLGYPSPSPPPSSYSGEDVSQGDRDGTRRQTDPAAAERTIRTVSSFDPPSQPQRPTAGSTQHNHIRTTLHDFAKPISTAADQPLMMSRGKPVDLPTTADVLKVFQSSAVPPPARTQPPTKALTSDPNTTPSRSPGPSTIPTTTTATSAAAEPEVSGSNCGPVAIVGPDRNLFLPLSSFLLDGSRSTDDRGITGYHWDAVSSPPGLQMEGVHQAVATALGLRVGRYTFRLTVSDQEGATDSASLTVRVQEATSLSPVAHASGSHTLTLPNNSLVLHGSVTPGEQTDVQYRWVRDRQSPAAGDVLFDSDSQASLCLANMVEGTYLFHLKVTDAHGRSSTSTATVEVRPEPGGGEEVELEMSVSVSQVSVAQRDTVVRQLAALIHVLDSDIQVRALRGHRRLSTVLRFSVQGPSGSTSGSRLVLLLRNQLLREKSDYLLFRVLRINTVLCLLRCSGRGQCNPVTKECTCDPLWTENLIRRYLGDGESNCEWRLLYVVLTSFVLIACILSASWTFICCCKRRRQMKVRKKTKYTILDNMDEQERVELRPKFSIKHRSTEHNSSLMMSESELDSDQDTIFTRDRPVRSRNRLGAHATRNGNAIG